MIKLPIDLATFKKGSLVGPKVEYEKDATGSLVGVLAGISRIAKAHPEKVAVRYHEQSLSYRELMHRVKTMAGFLAQSGVKTGEVVLCYGNRNIDYVVGILATMSLGGVYAPLDPYASEKALKDRLETVGEGSVLMFPELLASQYEKIAGVVRESSLSSVKFSDCDFFAEYELAKVELSMDQPAYCGFTSGSTGKSKGALVSHRGMLNHNQSKRDLLTLSPDDVVAQSASQNFDVHIWQMLAPLMAGSTVLVVDKCVADNPLDFISMIISENVSVVEFVPTIFGLIVDQLKNGEHAHDLLAKVNHILLTGERLPISLCQKWFEYRGNYAESGHGISLINAYGPAECSDDVGHYLVESTIEADPPIFSLPIQNTSVIVLAPDYMPAKVGEEGELFVLGDALGLGYLNNPEKTAEAFVGFATADGHELKAYRTGDKVKLSEHGVMFLGRMQEESFVKVGGKKLEFSPIVKFLESQPGVNQAHPVVLNQGETTRIGCYVTLSPDYTKEITAACEREHTEQVASIFDDAVTSSVSETFPPGLNHSGWNNYNGKPFSRRAAMENLDDAAGHVKNYIAADSKVLEVGCGTGMVAYRVAPHCKEYVGIDPSEQSVEIAKKDCAEFKHANFQKYFLDEYVAANADEKFDVIYLNAVINYLSSEGDLLEMIDQLMSLLKEDGRLLFLDVYHLDMQELLHTEFSYLRARGSETTVRGLRNRIRFQVDQQDPDLWLKPEFFAGLRDRYEGVEHLSMFLKAGAENDESGPNPMVKYRYGVVLSKNANDQQLTTIAELNWQKVSAEGLGEAITAAGSPDAFMLCGVPNPRLQSVGRLKACVDVLAPEDDMPKLQSVVRSAAQQLYGARQQRFESIAEGLATVGYKIASKTFNMHDSSCVDMAVVKADLSPSPHCISLSADAAGLKGRLTSTPNIASVCRRAEMVLREALVTGVQDGGYCSVRVLPELPLSASGKVDRARLVQEHPIDAALDVATSFFAGIDEGSSTEQALDKIFLATLRNHGYPINPGVGREEPLDSLALPSLLKIAMVARINQDFGLRMSFADLESHASFADLAQGIAALLPAAESLACA